MSGPDEKTPPKPGGKTQEETAGSPPDRPGDAGAGADARRRRTPILEGAVAEMLRRGIEAGWDRVSRGEHRGALRAVLGDLKIPKEVAGYVASQLDDTKTAILKVAAKEIREFLETSHFADELARLLTTLSFEIKTEVRFVPNEEGRKLRPKITSKAQIRRRKTDEP